MAYFSSPGELWGALGNVLGSEGLGGWAMNKGTQFGNWAMQPENALGLLAGAGTAMGGIGQITSAMQAGDRSRELSRLARQPMPTPSFDPNAFYQPLTQAAQDAYARQLRQEMQSYGAPMQGAYSANAVAEGVAKNEGERRAQAMQLALQKYGADLGAGQAQRYAQLQALGMRPGLPAIGNMGALGDFFKWRALQNARQRGNQPSPGATAGGTMPGGVPPSNYWGTGPNVAATGNLYSPDAYAAEDYQTPFGAGEAY